MVSEKYPSARVVANTFDNLGQLASVSSNGANATPHIYANGFGYNEKGVMDRMRLGNGLWESYQVNSRFQTTEIGLGTSANSTNRLRLNYSYGGADNNGNVRSQTITVPTINGATGFVTTQDYTYDDLNRLASVKETQYGQTTPDWQQQFGYDRYGNRAMGTGSGQTFGRNSAETLGLIGPDPTVSTSTNRITNRNGEQYQFDASGNMIRDALGNRSVFDVENHQTEYFYAANTTETADAKYFYDGEGRRIKKTVGAETTIFVYDAGGKMVAEYTLGATANPNPQTSYLTTDTLGSTRVTTNAAGQIIARHDYLPFGDEMLGLGGRTSAQGFGMPDATRQRFTGYEKDAESGLDFAKARYYGNGRGRFTGVDPAIQSAKGSLPQSWNRYSYCINNPLNLTDPTGEEVQLRGNIQFLLNEYLYQQVGGQDTFEKYFKYSDGKVSLLADADFANANAGVLDLRSTVAATEVYLMYAGTKFSDLKQYYAGVQQMGGDGNISVVPISSTSAKNNRDNFEARLENNQGQAIYSTTGRPSTFMPANLEDGRAVFAVIAFNTNWRINQEGVSDIVSDLCGRPVSLADQVSGLRQEVRPVSLFIHEVAENRRFAELARNGIKPTGDTYLQAHRYAMQTESILRNGMAISGGFGGGRLKTTLR